MKPRKGETDQKFLNRVLSDLLKLYPDALIVASAGEDTLMAAGGKSRENAQAFIHAAVLVLSKMHDELAEEERVDQAMESRILEVLHHLTGRGAVGERN